jgi:hypothetical protein
MDKPDFSGVWKFNLGRSSLEIPPPDSTRFVINHREPQFRLERTHTFAGTADFFAIDLSTAGDTVESIHAGISIRSRLTWEGDDLVFFSEMRRGDAHGTNIVRYRLTDNGRTFVARERLDFEGQSHENIWVFDRQ